MNSSNESKGKRDFTSSNNLDNDMMEYEIKLQSSKIESKNKTNSISRNNVDRESKL